MDSARNYLSSWSLTSNPLLSQLYENDNESTFDKLRLLTYHAMHGFVLLFTCFGILFTYYLFFGFTVGIAAGEGLSDSTENGVNEGISVLKGEIRSVWDRYLAGMDWIDRKEEEERKEMIRREQEERRNWGGKKQLDSMGIE